MRYLPLVLIVACVNFTLQSGEAAARSIKDCEKIKAADAYNLCLASFGPVAHERSLKPVPASAGSGKIHIKGRHYHRYRAHYRRHSGVKMSHRGHHKRKQMQLSVGPSNSQD